MTSSRKMWLSCAVACVVVVMATAAGDEYLPPNKGYNYEPPKIPFPTDQNGNQQPTPGPFRPPTPTPGYRPQPPPQKPPTRPQQPPTRPQQPPTRPQQPPTRPQQPPTRPPNTYVPPPTNTDHEHEHHDEHHHHEPGMPFDFAYAVNEDDNNYSHNAVSDGDVTRGEYRVALPDGRTQVVKYTADWKNGFNAEVSYEGEAQYPESQPGPGYGSGPTSNPGYGSGPTANPNYSGGSTAGQAYIPPNQGGGYVY